MEARAAKDGFEGETMMNRLLFWSVTLVAAMVAYLWAGSTPLSATCPPSPQCPCP
jgi:hypothetical protein